MILIDAAALGVIVAAAERAYPEECCGLLIGRRRPDGAVAIARAQAVANVALTARTRSFQIDPAARIAATRALRGGPELIVGHYHSHPDRPAEPSARDVAAAFEPDLVWLITAVAAGRAGRTAAYRIAGRRATRLDLVVTSGQK